jgi:hypothetical protein
MLCIRARRRAREHGEPPRSLIPKEIKEIKYLVLWPIFVCSSSFISSLLHLVYDEVATIAGHVKRQIPYQ